MIARVLCILAGTLATLRGQEIEVLDAAERGVARGGLERIRRHTAEQIERGVIAGAVSLLARDGEVVHLDAQGWRDREAKAPMTVDTIFRIYSMTKPVTSVAVMLLQERGLLELDDPVAKYLPELAERQVLEPVVGGAGTTFTTRPAIREITVRDLLRHTSGFVYGVNAATELDRRYQAAGILEADHSPAETVAKLASQPLLVDPGAAWIYALNCDVLGRLVEVVSGQRFGEFLAENLFAPLGMQDTGFVVPAEQRHRLAQLYAPAPGGSGLVPKPELTRSYQGVEGYESGGAGLYSTIRDYWHFCAFLLGQGEWAGRRLLKAETVAAMTRDQLEGVPASYNWGAGVSFGLGFSVVQDPDRTEAVDFRGEYGWGGAAGTAFFVAPEEGLVGIYMIQVLPGPAGVGAAFKDLAHQALE